MSVILSRSIHPFFPRSLWLIQQLPIRHSSRCVVLFHSRLQTGVSVFSVAFVLLYSHKYFWLTFFLLLFQFCLPGFPLSILSATLMLPARCFHIFHAFALLFSLFPFFTNHRPYLFSQRKKDRFCDPFHLSYLFSFLGSGGSRSLRVRLIRPLSSISMTFTRISSPIFTTSSTFSTRSRASLEM